MTETRQHTQQSQPHNLILENKRALTATGIKAVVAYDANDVILETAFGTLTIGGRELNVSELSVQTGEIKVTGDIEFMQYTRPKQDKKGFLQRLVR